MQEFFGIRAVGRPLVVAALGPTHKRIGLVARHCGQRVRTRAFDLCGEGLPGRPAADDRAAHVADLPDDGEFTAVCAVVHEVFGDRVAGNDDVRIRVKRAILVKLDDAAVILFQWAVGILIDVYEPVAFDDNVFHRIVSEIDCAAAIIKCIVADYGCALENILCRIGVVNIAVGAARHCEGGVGGIAVTERAGDNLFEGAVCQCGDSGILKLEFRVADLIFFPILIEAAPTITVRRNIGGDVFKMNVGDIEVCDSLKNLILGVWLLHTMDDVDRFIRFPLDGDALSVESAVSGFDCIEKFCQCHRAGVFQVGLDLGRTRDKVVQCGDQLRGDNCLCLGRERVVSGFCRFNCSDVLCRGDFVELRQRLNLVCDRIGVGLCVRYLELVPNRMERRIFLGENTCPLVAVLERAALGERAGCRTLLRENARPLVAVLERAALGERAGSRALLGENTCSLVAVLKRTAFGERAGCRRRCSVRQFICVSRDGKRG